MADNPFRASGRVVGDDFFGRTETIRAVVHHLRGKSNVAICAPARTGKSSLLTVLFRNYRRAEPDALTWFVDLANLNALPELIAEFFYAMRLPETNYTLREFARHLKTWDHRLVIFLDNAERFAAPPFNEEAFFALLASHMPTQHISLCATTTLPPATLFTNRIGLPLHSYFVSCDLPPFSPAECTQFIQQKLQWTGVVFGEEDIFDLIETSGGQPAELQRLAAELYRKRTGNRPAETGPKKSIALRQPTRRRRLL